MEPDRVLDSHTSSKRSHNDDFAVGEVGSDEHGFLAKLVSWENWLDRKFGVESQGARRVPEDERHPPNLWMMFLMWSSTGTYSIAGVTTGLLPWQYGLTLGQGIGILALGSILGAACSVSSSCLYEFV